MTKDPAEYSDFELFCLLHSDKSVSDRAFAELYNRLSPRVFAYCRRFLGNREEAEDVFQETFVKFFQSARHEREMSNIPAFILRIARNLCVNFKRREKSAVSFEDYMVVRNDSRNDQDELLNLIKMALDILPDELREVFILREYDGLSYQEISEVVETNLSNVKVRIFRAKQRIREILAPYLVDLEKS